MKKILVFLALASVAARAEAQSAGALVQRAAARYAAMKSMRAEFQQTIANPLTGTTSVSRGEILRRDPNLLSINFTDPRGDRVVADGSWVWVYLPSSAPGQVIKLNAGSSMGIVDPGALFLEEPLARFSVTSAGAATINGRNTQIAILTPKRADAALTRVKVWIDPTDASVRQFEATDANGLTRLVAITKLTVNPTIARSAFRFTPPARVRIVDSAALRGM
ncbi:MAG TPA: outer membrane lipoprotein carrier protein LolA [Gemmatimonadaceae bacterium]